LDENYGIPSDADIPTSFMMPIYRRQWNSKMSDCGEAVPSANYD